MTLQNKHRNLYNSFFLIVFVSTVAACATASPSHKVTAHHQVLDPGKAPTLIILPFENAPAEKDLNQLIRKQVEENLRSHNYHVLAVDEVDRALGLFEHTLEEQWQDFSPRTLGKLFHCNYLLSGRIHTFHKRFWGLYAVASLGVQVKLVETANGTTLWTGKVMKRAHEVGIPFSFFDMLPEFLHCSPVIPQKTKRALIHNLSKQLTDTLPEAPRSADSVFIVALQIASFAEKNLAVATLQALQARGFDVRMEKVMLPNGAWYRIMMGPFYDEQEALLSKRRIEKEQRFHPVFIYY